jgi:hypothetical protein
MSSFLDQLKKQAEQVKAQEDAIEKKKKQLAAHFEKVTKPKMRQIHSYLFEMVEQLKLIQPNPPVHYTLPILGEYKGLKQDEYILSGFDDQNLSFFLRIACHTSRKNVFEIKEEPEVEKMRNYLYSHNIRFKWIQENDKQQRFFRAIFQLNGEIFLEFNFCAEPETANISLNVRNFDEFGKVDYLIPPQDIDSKFLDQLAMYMTRNTPDNILQEYIITQNRTRINASDKDRVRAQILAELAEKRKTHATNSVPPLLKPKQTVVSPLKEKMEETVEETPIDIKTRLINILNTKIL